MDVSQLVSRDYLETARLRERDRRLVRLGHNRARMLRRRAARAGLPVRVYAAFADLRREIAAQRALARAIIGPPQPRTRMSSDERRARQRAAYKANPEVWYRAANARRARLKGVEHEPVSRRAILERDGWRCRVCRCKVRDDLPRAHPRRAILAHIVAVAAGGAHTAANLCCLCYACNRRDYVNRLPIQCHL